MRAWRGVAAAAIGTGACVALVVEAAADEPRMALAWSAPAECPDEATVRAGVAQLLAGSSAKVEGRAEVSRSGERWQVVLRMNGGERRLEADSCRALADATSLIVAMAVDPARVVANRSVRDAEVADGGAPIAAAPVADASPDAAPVSPPDAAPSPPLPPPAPSVSTPPATAAPPSPPQPPPLQRQVAFSAAATTDVGTLPTASFGPSVGFAWIPWPLRLELAVAYFPSSSATVPGSPLFAQPPTGSYVQFSLLSASARVCYQAHLGVFDLGPCGGVEAGLLFGSPQGFQSSASTGSSASSGSAPLFALDAGLLGAWRVLPHWALFARGDGLLQTSRPVFEFNGATLNQPGLVSGRGSLGVELRF